MCAKITEKLQNNKKVTGVVKLFGSLLYAALLIYWIQSTVHRATFSLCLETGIIGNFRISCISTEFRYQFFITWGWSPKIRNYILKSVNQIYIYGKEGLVIFCGKLTCYIYWLCTLKHPVSAPKANFKTCFINITFVRQDAFSEWKHLLLIKSYVLKHHLNP